MKISKYHKIVKLIYIKTLMFAMFAILLFAKEFPKLEKTGDNYFHVYLNGKNVGIVGEKEDAKQVLIQARKEIAKTRDTLMFMEADLTFQGEEVLWGLVDDNKKIQAKMQEILKESIIETVQPSYTVKVNEYMVSLATMEEVTKLLQAAVDKFKGEEEFDIALVQDNTREFNVLTAKIEDVEQRRLQEEKENANVFLEAGIQARISEMLGDITPTIEYDFDDYDQGIREMHFTDEVEIVEAYLPGNQLASLEVAIEELVKEQEQETIYEVQSGDTLSEIAIKVNIPMNTIIDMNDSLENEFSTLQIGQEIVITVPEPELSVGRSEVNYYEETYNAEIIYVDNDEWYTTQTVILQQPSTGFRRVMADETYINDDLTERIVLKEEVLMEAVPKIVERGTKIPPTYIKPVAGGRLSSTFGRRSAPTKGASSYHKGIDWAVPVGTPVKASCGGTVAKAGWGSGYGYVVYINHADGRQTRYAHLSKVQVKVGAVVSQGQQIALSGNTGISSGPHVHFELLIGGSQVDPLKYLN